MKKMFAKLVGHENLVRDVAWHPNDANIVVTVGDDGKVKVFDVRKGGHVEIITTQRHVDFMYSEEEGDSR